MTDKEEKKRVACGANVDDVVKIPAPKPDNIKKLCDPISLKPSPIQENNKNIISETEMLISRQFTQKTTEDIENKTIDEEDDEYDEDFDDNEYDEDLDDDYYNDFDYKSNEFSQINTFSISIDKTGRIKSFPLDFRSLICKRINNLIDSGSKEKDIIKIITDDIINRNNWISELNYKTYTEFLKKFTSEKYKNSIIEYINDLVKTILILKNNSSISLAEVSRFTAFHQSIISQIAKSILSKEVFFERYLKSSAHSNIQSDLMIVLDKFLVNKKQEILNLGFIPTRENIIRNCEQLNPLDEDRLHRKVGWWIRHNTSFTGVKQMIREKFDKTDISKSLYEILDKKKEDILTGYFIPNVKNLIKINDRFNLDITRNFVNIWLEKNSSFKNLTQLIEFFKPSVSLLGYSLKEQEDYLLTHLSKIISSFTLFSLPRDFIKIPKDIYQDILASILPRDDKSSFDIFYESFTTIKSGNLFKVGLRSEKPLAVLLFYYSLIFFITGNNTILEQEKFSTLKAITLEKLENENGLGHGSLKKKSGRLYSYIINIKKYQVFFDKLSEIRHRQPKDSNRFSLIKQFKDDVQYNIYNWSSSNLDFLKNNSLKEVFLNILSNIEKNKLSSIYF